MTIQLVLDGTGLMNSVQAQFDRKKTVLNALFRHYSVEILKWMQMQQGGAPSETMGRFWTNHTFKAVESLFTQVIKSKEEMVLNIEYDTRHASYVKYLEYDHNGRFAALPTILNTFADALINDLRILYGDDSL
ncbi:MAG: hypothetical protein DRP09_13805 [Candidatus Thorarchaeota archaeon]|nr:MAG: hypothetical protein DRP09_13805 [Candidatus Thorarchaeota archaeon]